MRILPFTYRDNNGGWHDCQMEGNPEYFGRKARTEFDVIQAVCDYFGLQYDDVISDSRLHEHAVARHIISDLLLKFGCTYKRIGRLLGDRHHSTVRNSVVVCESMTFNEHQFRHDYNMLYNKIFGY